MSSLSRGKEPIGARFSVVAIAPLSPLGVAPSVSLGENN